MASPSEPTAAATRRWLEWNRLGDPLPGKLVQVLQREFRPVGAGTATEEWALIEWEEREDADA